jgi:hypothetical protein
MPTGGALERLFACTYGVDKSPRLFRAKAHGRMAGAPLWFDTRRVGHPQWWTSFPSQLF